MRTRLLAALVAIGPALAACGSGADTPVSSGFENVRVLTGRADAGEGGLSIETGDWTYGGDFGFAWTDAAGTWHDGGRPECLPTGASRQVTFAATEVTVDGRRWRPIIWLDCR